MSTTDVRNLVVTHGRELQAFYNVPPETLTDQQIVAWARANKLLPTTADLLPGERFDVAPDAPPGPPDALTTARSGITDRDPVAGQRRPLDEVREMPARSEAAERFGMGGGPTAVVPGAAARRR